MTANTINSYRLGIEELAMVLNLAGSPEAAKQLLIQNFGEMNEDEERGRLLAASHSLMAKGLVKVNNDLTILDKKYAEFVQSIFANEFYIRFSKNLPEAEEILIHYFQDERIISHQVTSGVVHELNPVTDFDKVVRSGIEFFELDSTEDFDSFEVDVAYSLLETIKAEAVTQPDKIVSEIDSIGVPEPTCHLLAEDLIQPAYYGSVMRLEIVEEELRSDRGFLILRGKKRCWLFRILSSEDNQTIARVKAGTHDTFIMEVQALR